MAGLARRSKGRQWKHPYVHSASPASPVGRIRPGAAQYRVHHPVTALSGEVVSYGQVTACQLDWTTPAGPGSPANLATRGIPGTRRDIDPAFDDGQIETGDPPAERAFGAASFADGRGGGPEVNAPGLDDDSHDKRAGRGGQKVAGISGPGPRLPQTPSAPRVPARFAFRCALVRPADTGVMMARIGVDVRVHRVSNRGGDLRTSPPDKRPDHHFFRAHAPRLTSSGRAGILVIRTHCRGRRSIP